MLCGQRASLILVQSQKVWLCAVRSKVRHNQGCVCTAPKCTAEWTVAMATQIAGALLISSQVLESREWLCWNDRMGNSAWVCWDMWINAYKLQATATVFTWQPASHDLWLILDVLNKSITLITESHVNRGRVNISKLLKCLNTLTLCYRLHLSNLSEKTNNQLTFIWLYPHPFVHMCATSCCTR